MASLSSIVDRIDALVIAKLGAPTAHAFGLAEVVKTTETQYPANGEIHCGYSDIYPITWYHRSRGGTVNAAPLTGMGRVAYQEEKWDMGLFAYADRTKLNGILPDELYRRFAAAFPIYATSKPFDGLDVVKGSVALRKFSLDRSGILQGEFGGDSNFGVNMIAIQLDYQIDLTMKPGCQVFPCIGPGCQ